MSCVIISYNIYIYTYCTVTYINLLFLETLLAWRKCNTIRLRRTVLLLTNNECSNLKGPGASEHRKMTNVALPKTSVMVCSLWILWTILITNIYIEYSSYHHPAQSLRSKCCWNGTNSWRKAQAFIWKKIPGNLFPPNGRNHILDTTCVYIPEIDSYREDCSFHFQQMYGSRIPTIPFSNRCMVQ